MPPFAAFEQNQVVVRFQCLDLMRQGRLVQVNPLGSGGQFARFGNGQQRAQVAISSMNEIRRMVEKCRLFHFNGIATPVPFMTDY